MGISRYLQYCARYRRWWYSQSIPNGQSDGYRDRYAHTSSDCDQYARAISDDESNEYAYTATSSLGLTGLPPRGTPFGRQESSAGGYEIIDATNPRSGSYSAYLCGYSGCNDSITQDFTVPDGATNITVSYWWYGDTTRTAHSCRDVFTADLVGSNGKVIAKLQQACNTNATQTWQQVSFGATNALSRYAGQTVTLIFNARTTYSVSVTSAFFVDDVEVHAS